MKLGREGGVAVAGLVFRVRDLRVPRGSPMPSALEEVGSLGRWLDMRWWRVERQ